jgi:hypothetical protein
MSGRHTGPRALTGGCMCGATRLEISSPLLGAVYCHCRRCQKRTGSAASASALTQPGSFAIVQGEEAVVTYDPGDGGWLKSFCRECGSQLFTTHPEQPELVAVRMGALDGDPGVRPGIRQFVDYAAVWEPIPDDGLPRHPERMTWD